MDEPARDGLMDAAAAAALEAEAEAAPAIRALGSLFKVTEVFLWDDAVVDFSPALTHRDSSDDGTKNFCIADASSSAEPSVNDCTSLEDLELAQQMGALGLPISFTTAKEKKNLGSGGKRKGTRAKSLSADKDSENRARGLPKAGEWEDITSSRVLNASTNVHFCCNTSNFQTEVSYDDYQEHSRGELSRGDSHSDEESIHAVASVFCENRRMQVNDEITILTLSNSVNKELKSGDDDTERSAETTELPISSDAGRLSGNDLEDASCILYHAGTSLNKEDEASSIEVSSILNKTCVGDLVENYTSETCSNSVVPSVSCALIDQKVQDYPNSTTCYEFDDWRVAWDAFYLRYYFYNCQTQESTWYPPAGWEHFAHGCSTTNTTEMITDKVIEDTGLEAFKGQDAYGLHDGADSFQEGRSCEYINLSLEEISSKNEASSILMSQIDSPNNNCGLELLDKHAEPRQVAVHFSDVNEQITDQPDVNECVVTREDCCTHPEVYDVPENFLEVPMRNSSTSILAEMGRGEISCGVSVEIQATFIMDEIDSHLRNFTRKKKPRMRRPRSRPISQVTGGFPANIVKYWCQRYLLFSQFDNGIKMDEEGWFSVTPESIARHHASRYGNGTVIDCFTGVGGNAIQFAMKSNHVIAIDIDSQRIDYAQHNAAIYGVHDKIDFIIADFFQVAPRLKGDVVFMSPPWGGPDYSKAELYDIITMLQPHDGYSLFKIAKAIASKVVMFLPRNVDLNQLAELSLSASPPCTLEVEKNYVNGKLKAVTAYFDITAV